MLIPFSILDLAPITEGSNASVAFRNTLDLARHAERLGYHRYWLAEHHNMTGIASAATSVVIGYVAGGTSTIRVGAGGVMLPNHAPLLIAEQFGTLEAMYPGRIDLGLGRAPGTDPVTSRALRRNLGAADTFPDDVMELQTYFREPVEGQAVRAVPGAGLKVPIWLLGSSLFSARLAAMLGLPFAFASHFAPDQLLSALRIYRSEFKPSDVLDEPYAMAAVNVFAADTDDEGRRLFTSVQRQFASLRQGGDPGLLQPPVDYPTWSPLDQRAISHALSYSAVGSRESVRKAVQAFLDGTKVNELMVTSQIYDHEARKRSYEILWDLREDLVG